MKKLLLALLSLLLCNCGQDIYYMTDGLMVDVDRLLDYNAILCHEERGVCGSTVVYSDHDRTCVITAAHCVGWYIQHKIEVNDGTQYNVEMEDAEIVNSDLALFCGKNIPILDVASVAYTEPEVAESVWIVGYPAREKDALTRGVVSKINTTGHYGRPMDYFDITAWYGSSGSGVMNKYGQLVSVVSQFGAQFDTPDDHGAETGWIYGCRIKEIRRLLRANGID